MVLDGNEGIQITEENTPQIKDSLRMPIQVLYGGSSVNIVVPNFDFARQLVGGANPPMKQWVDELSRINGINKLGSDSVNFQIVDFTKFGDPNILWRTAMSQIPEIEKVNISQKGKGFNDFYPGKVMVIIGPQNIPDNVQLDGFGRVSKLAPTIFIQRKNVEFARMNPIVKNAIAANTSTYHAVSNSS